MIVRLRPRMSADTLQVVYAEPHDHRMFGRGHAERVAAMMRLSTGRWKSAADLSCGNGAVLAAVDTEVKYFGDLAPGWPIHGPIEDTVHAIPAVDLFIMGETLEHLDQPDHVLVEVAAIAQHLVLSTPIDNWGDTNAEHYWSWNREDVEGLLAAAGFAEVEAFETVDSRTWGEPYCYGIWRVSW